MVLSWTSTKSLSGCVSDGCVAANQTSNCRELAAKQQARRHIFARQARFSSSSRCALAGRANSESVSSNCTDPHCNVDHCA